MRMRYGSTLAAALLGSYLAKREGLKVWREWQRALELDAQSRDGSLPRPASSSVDAERALQVAAWR